MSEKCPYCFEECKEETLPNVLGFFSRDNTKEYICNNPECKHFGETVVY